jgi:hypothetical protein
MDQELRVPPPLEFGEGKQMGISRLTALGMKVTEAIRGDRIQNQFRAEQ